MSSIDLSALIIGTVSGILCIITYKVIVFYSNVRKYPKGPTPLPLLGNILHFRSPRHVYETIFSFAKTYGPVYTIWFGPLPHIVVTDPQLVLEVLKRKECAGRPEVKYMDELFGANTIDIIFSDFSKGWEVLRRVAYAAIRKYAVSDSLPQNLVPVVDDSLANMKRERVFLPQDHLETMMMSISASSAFGKAYTFDDPKFLHSLIESLKCADELAMVFLLVQFIPFSKYLFWQKWKKLVDVNRDLRKYCHQKYKDHLHTLDHSVTRDFMDAMIQAKREAEEEDKHQAEYLTPMNIVNSVLDLFFAGSDTTRTTLDWWFVLCANFPDMQDRMRREIEAALDEDELPTLAIREKCPFTQAFLAEVLRYRHIAPANLVHKIHEDITIGGAKIPAGTGILPTLQPSLHDDDVWKDPNELQPERFLHQDGSFNPRPNSLYIPFSGGRRGCIGERLALSNMFIIITRLLQKTRGWCFVLDGVEAGHAHLDGDVNNPRMLVPKAQKIRLEVIP